jgi:hypothetical protein
MIKPHLNYAHNYWRLFVRPGYRVIDATVGNGHDTLFLAQLLKGEGELIGYDIQLEALDQAKLRLQTLSDAELKMITLKCRSHASFEEEYANLIVYNLGYLPGGNKRITTCVETTLQSLKDALHIAKGGAISITCYPGHEEGRREQGAVLDFLKTISPSEWQVCFHEWLNRPLSPTLLWLQGVPGP